MERENRTTAPVDYLASENMAPAEPDVVPKDYAFTPVESPRWLKSRWATPLRLFKRFCDSDIVKALMRMYPGTPAPLRVCIIILQVCLVMTCLWSVFVAPFFN